MLCTLSGISPLRVAETLGQTSGVTCLENGGTWVAQLVKCLTLDFDLGRDFTVVRLSPVWGSTLSVEPAWDSLHLCLPLPTLKKKKENKCAWVSQLVERLTLAQVMISLLVGSSPALGSVLTAQSQEPALDSVSFSDPPLLVLCLSQKIN